MSTNNPSRPNARLAEQKARQEAKKALVRPIYYAVALQAGLPQQITDGIRNDRWMKTFLMCDNHRFSDSALHTLLHIWTGRPINRTESLEPQNLQYHRYYASMNIARMAVDIEKITQGRYQISTNRDNALYADTFQDLRVPTPDDLDELSIGIVRALVPKKLEDFACHIGEPFRTEGLVSLGEGRFSNLLHVQPGGQLATVLDYHTTGMVPKAGPVEVTADTRHIIDAFVRETNPATDIFPGPKGRGGNQPPFT